MVVEIFKSLGKTRKGAKTPRGWNSAIFGSFGRQKERPIEAAFLAW
jgi:hypothetical protein